MTVGWHDITGNGKIIYAETTIEDITDWIVSAIDSYYDVFKTSEDSSLENVYFGDPPVIPKFPSVAVLPLNEEYTDEPQRTGAEGKTTFDIIFYTHFIGNSKEDDGMMTRKSLRLGKILRQIFLWDNNLHVITATDTGRVAEVLVGAIDYGEFAKSNQEGEMIGIVGGRMPLTVLFWEGGY